MSAKIVKKWLWKLRDLNIVKLTECSDCSYKHIEEDEDNMLSVVYTEKSFTKILSDFLKQYKNPEFNYDNLNLFINYHYEKANYILLCVDCELIRKCSIIDDIDE